MQQIRFTILGAGIGGLTTAIAMQRKGLHVTIYESAPQIKPVGAGLGMAANAIKAFHEIGIGDKIERAGKVLKSLAIKTSEGSILSKADSETISKKLGVTNNFTIHRADLHDVLLKELLPNTLHVNKRCIDVQQTDDGVRMTFHDGTSIFTDYVIASDGIHSVVRKKLLPDVMPRYAGYTCWRAVIENVPAGFDFNTTTETWGREGRFGIAPLSNNRVYWFACINAERNDQLKKAFGIKELLTYFGEFHDPIPQLLKLTRYDQLIWGDILDIQPLTKFAFGKIVLIGDAAHATTPNMGQGACMAIEDAAILANILAVEPNPEKAFVIFEQKRIKRTTRIVNNSWTFGKMAQQQNLFLTGLRNAAMRLVPASVAEKQIQFVTEVSFQYP
jgi:2-polyprenyl-6-methoxyphenol hydroxylase-like FAD-dependent oxidoreductase